MNIGDKYNRLTYIEESTKRCGGNKYGYFKCDCGNIKEILLCHVKHNNTKSCGCFLKDKLERRDGNAAIFIVYSRYRSRALKYNLPFNLSLEEFISLSEKECHYCGSKPSRLTSTDNGHNYTIYNGIDRVDNDLGYIQGNVVPCCTMSNRAKGAHSYNFFLSWIKQVMNHLEKNVKNSV